jgi:hypothetical protein
MAKPQDFRAVLKEVAAARKGPLVATAKKSKAAAKVSGKPVIFFCDNPGCVVGLKAKTVSIVFIGTGGANLPLGSYFLFYRVRGNSGDEFTITAEDAAMEPIVDRIPDGKKSTGGNHRIEV